MKRSRLRWRMSRLVQKMRLNHKRGQKSRRESDGEHGQLFEDGGIKAHAGLLREIIAWMEKHGCR